MSDRITVRVAQSNDSDALLALMRGYYRDDGLAFDETHARRALVRLLREPQWGCVLMAEVDGVTAGYTAMCIGFSLELGGNDAFLDELYVEPAYRAQGIAHRLIDALEAQARQQGIVALHLEVDRENEIAQRLYRSLGYGAQRNRYYLMSKSLM